MDHACSGKSWLKIHHRVVNINHERRNLTHQLLAALRDTPVVYLQGPRQSGKSSLAQALASEGIRRSTSPSTMARSWPRLRAIPMVL